MCIKGRQEKWRSEHPKEYGERGRLDTILRASRKNEVKRKLFEKQDGLCLFCGTDLPLELSMIALDHDHACHPGNRGCKKCWRGLLHKSCNFAVGLAERSPASLDKAIKFLSSLRKEVRYG